VKIRIAFMMAMFCLGLVSLVSGAESNKYPAPRFPSYLRPAKSLDDIMPFARAAVRQTGGRTPLGLVEKGMAALIVSEVTADAMVIQAIKKAYEERGVKVYIVSEDELLGINKEEAQKAIQAMNWYTSEQGYMEVRRWIDDLFIDAEVPKKWLKERRPDLYSAIYTKGEEVPQKTTRDCETVRGPQCCRGYRQISRSTQRYKSRFLAPRWPAAHCATSKTTQRQILRQFHFR
jgi:hypothetical protein